jgi:hypothetical protein
MGYLSGSILLSVRLRMGPARTTPRLQRLSSAGLNPPPLHSVQWQGVVDHVKRNVAVRTKLG